VTLLHEPLGEDEDGLMRIFLALVCRSEPEVICRHEVRREGGERERER
jgi:hypothetical protein